MSELLVSGGTPLEGELTVHGAKNSVLPILAACLLTREQVTIHNCPRLTDVAAALEILEHLGCTAQWDDGALRCALWALLWLLARRDCSVRADSPAATYICPSPA